MRGACLWLVAACGRLQFDELSTPADDGGASDGGGSDAVDASAVLCPPGMFDLCDSFETGIDLGLWSLTTTNVSLDTSFARRGTSSVHVHSPAFPANSGPYDVLAETQTITGGATTFWIRAWFWLSALPASNNGLELVSAQRPSGGGDYVFVFSDATHIYSQYEPASDTDPTTVPTGTWFCSIFRVTRSTGSAGSLALTGDVPSLALPAIATDGATPITVITLGVGFSSTNTPSAQPAFDLWIDDVIVHSQAVTCQD